MTTVKDIIGEMVSPSPEDETLIRTAYDFAKKAHEGHQRYSGEPYFLHPAAVAKQLASMHLDAQTVAAGLLHDAIEDTDTTDEAVAQVFGDEVLFLVRGVTKLGRHKYRGAERHAESLRRLLVATSADIRVLIIKLVDRYHNMTTLEYVPKHKQRRIALETMEIFAPIADRLGMGRLKRELEDLAFPYIDPDAYRHTAEVRKLMGKETEEGLAHAKKTLQRELVRRGLTGFHTEIRMKGLWSLHQKLKRKHDDITQIHDIAALRVIVPKLEDCYPVLGAIHALWKPLPGNFKDYIAFPKPNGYQSLHTTVVTGDAGTVEMQVRTEEMHRHAQFGIASHMTYKTLGKNAPKASFERFSLAWIRGLIPSLLHLSKRDAVVETSPKIAHTEKSNSAFMPPWLSELAEAHTSITGADEFITGLKEDFFSHRVFVFTPMGDVVDLPIRSTPIDFAYAIHSDIGNHMQGAKVNGKLASFDSPLANGDIVEILTRKTVHPTTKWLEYARTTLARRHIRTALMEIDAAVPTEKTRPNTPTATRARPRRTRR
ncbi:MAG: hypothetical protein B7X04_03025 [Parcubacteria group bacterium 21-54-25]|nr:MAG: hypothetical protein B7X04_03025 [Parcubacteria group bacterium 21-54-25]HQU07925.1 HD domain-containing protein [Candidatus Paceibacterota bacterium]